MKRLIQRISSAVVRRSNEHNNHNHNRREVWCNVCDQMHEEPAHSAW